MSVEQPPKINRPEDSEKNGDFWEKRYDDGNSDEKAILFCPQCGGQVTQSSQAIEAGELKCQHCGFEGETHQDIVPGDEEQNEKEAA